MTLIHKIAVLLIAAFMPGCSDVPATPTSPSSGGGSLALTAEQLNGTWTLTSMQVAGQSAQSVPAGATYTLSFADGRLATRADCNTCGGAFTLLGDTLTAGPNLACTRAACATMPFETAYTGVLAGESTISLTGTSLAFSSARGALHFSR